MPKRVRKKAKASQPGQPEGHEGSHITVTRPYSPIAISMAKARRAISLCQRAKRAYVMWPPSS